jgi:signal transduction histidine kinase
VTAVAAPAVVTVALLPVRSSFGLAGFLIWALLAVVASALVGGLRPALFTIAVGFPAALYFYAPPFDSFSTDLHPNLAALVAFLAVGTVAAPLVDKIARLAVEQAALRRVATLVASAVAPQELFARVTEEVGRLFGAGATYLVRYATGDGADVVGSWRDGTQATIVSPEMSFEDAGLGALVARGAGAVRVDGILDRSDRFVLPQRLWRARLVLSRRGVRTGIGTPIVASNRPWGALLTLSKPGQRLSRNTEVRLTHFTELVAMAIDNAESRLELAASRARVVAAADEARRRIERDLHDGAQQRLVSLRLELGTVGAAVPTELTEVRERLDNAVRGLAELTSDLQELSRGIHPAILSKGGLGPVVKTLARRCAVPVELDLPPVGKLPDRIGVAVYFVVSEALTNAAKHAGASLVRVSLRVDAEIVCVTVSDDGLGGADPGRGSGLIGLKDRVESLGGRIELKSPLAGGTWLDAAIPLDLSQELEPARRNGVGR